VRQLRPWFTLIAESVHSVGVFMFAEMLGVAPERLFILL
jgi:hypothetical protein